MTTTLLSVTNGRKTAIDRVIDYTIVVDLGFGPETHPFTLHPEDTEGVGPLVAAYLATNFVFVADYVAPYIDPITLPLQAYQLHAGLELNGLDTLLDDAIAAIPDATIRVVLQHKLARDAYFLRTDPAFDQIGVAIGKTTQDIDALWRMASAL